MVSMLAVLFWPVVVFWLFATRKPAQALAASILGGYLFLPENYAIDLPAVPSLDKNSIAGLAAVLASAIFLKGPAIRDLPEGMVMPGIVPGSRAVRILLAVLLIGMAGTVVSNGDPVSYGPRWLPGLRFYDMLSFMGNMLFSLIPFLLARKYLAHPQAHIALLVSLAVFGLIYTLPALYEIRMSPQLSRMIYGYFPHAWLQHIRAGGYRPVVFLNHGLWLAIFLSVSFLAALTLWRLSSGPLRMRWLLASLWLLMTLILAKGMGALGIGILLGATILLMPVRLHILMAASISVIVLVYPMLRGAGWIPVDTVVSTARDLDPARAASLSFRLENEDILLAKANERPLFGWGGWGRNRVYNDNGVDISVTDGYWVQAMGVRGWTGYLAEMGLLAIPLVLLALRWRGLALTSATAGLALVLTANLIDLIPNATLTPVTWLLAGALAGRLELGRIRETAPGDAAEAITLRRNRYSRQTGLRARRQAAVPPPGPQ